MRVLVTGGNGFLGRRIVAQCLARGYEVRVFGRSAYPELESLGVDCCRGDLGSYEEVEAAVSGCDAVFHVAAKAGVWGCWDDYFRTNIEGSRHVVKACQVCGVGRLVYTSTPSVVFNRHAFRGADESLPYGQDWLCHYAHSKSIAEQEVLAAHSDALKIAALRPHLIWGVGDPHILPRVISRAAAGRLRMVGDGRNQVDLTHVENAAHAHMRALDALGEGRANGRAYFISDGAPVYLWDWINDLLSRMGIPVLEKSISLKKAVAVGAFMEGLWRLFRFKGEPPMTRFVAFELAEDHYFDISAARSELGYMPLISNEEGVRAYVDALKSETLGN